MSMFKEVLKVTSLKANPIRHPTKIISKEVRGENDTEKRQILVVYLKELLTLLTGDLFSIERERVSLRMQWIPSFYVHLFFHELKVTKHYILYTKYNVLLKVDYLFGVY